MYSDENDNVRASHPFDISIFLELRKIRNYLQHFNPILILVISLSQKKIYLSLHIQCRQQMINCLLMRIQINAADTQIITTPHEAWAEI